MSRSIQRLITVALIGMAALALVAGAAWQGDRTVTEPTVVGAGPAPGATATGGTAAPATATAPTSPVEGFLPRSGQASACREPVGVDLIPGFEAVLTINGVTIAPEEMNVDLDADGNPTGVITASRSLGQFTYGPEPDCPNGRVIRATDNEMQACVYRVEDGPESCVIYRFSFDVL